MYELVKDPIGILIISSVVIVCAWAVSDGLKKYWYNREVDRQRMKELLEGNHKEWG